MPKVLVLGGGIIGLAVANLLSEEENFEIIIYSDKDLMNTTSVGAGGLWMPFHCEPVNMVNKWATETFVFTS